MALPHNPFEKKPLKKQYTKIKVFEKAEIEISEHKELSNDSIMIQSLDNAFLTNSKSLDNDLKTNTNELINNTPIKSPTLAKSLFNHDSIIRKQLDINHLVGKEKSLICFIALKCKNRASLETEVITSEELKKILEVDNNGLANIIFRVKEKDYLTIVEQKKGRVSWRKFKISKEIYDQIITKGLENNISINSNTYPIPLENGSYSSNNNLNTNTMNEPFNFSIAHNLTKIGIGNKQLKNILDLKLLTEEEIQESLDHYSFDLENGIKPNLALFFGVLRKSSQYKSQKYSQILETEIEKEIQRIKHTNEIEKAKQQSEMYKKFEDFKNNNPEFIEKIKNEQKFQVSDSILETIAFQKFCSEQNGNV